MVLQEATATLLPKTGPWQADLTHSSVMFSIRHLGLSRVRGRFDQCAATLDVANDPRDTKVTATIALDSINTNNLDRDAHPRGTDFFRTDAHPEMTFVSNGLTGAGEDWTMTGDLTLNGITRPVSLEVTYEGLQENFQSGLLMAGFSAKGSLRRSEFGVEFGMMPLGADKLALADEVRIELEFEFAAPAA